MLLYELFLKEVCVYRSITISYSNINNMVSGESFFANSQEYIQQEAIAPNIILQYFFMFSLLI